MERPPLAIRRLKVRLGLVLAATTAFLATPSPASANHGPLPWAGGQSVVSNFERYAGELGSEMANRPVRVICNDQNDWNVLAAQGGFDPARVWGYVLFHWFRGPVDYTHLSPQACWYMDEFWGAADKKTQKYCQVGTKTEYRTEYRIETRARRVRVKVKGKWRTKRVYEQVTVPVQIAYQVPVFDVCADWRKKLFALQTLTHEAMHLFGIRNEARAECFGMQYFAWAVWKLGATPEFAREMATDNWSDYLRDMPGTEYYTPDCRDGGPLDLDPTSSVWP